MFNNRWNDSFGAIKVIGYVDKTKGAKSEEELNNPESIKELNNSEPSVELNSDEPVEPSIGPELTIPMPASSNAMKKSEFSVMISSLYDSLLFSYNPTCVQFSFITLFSQ
ncbi:hypothetical protein PVK06_047173 [Gossypium arboreum]|uniref:Uncharacterized protein n=1 Tax=Gossypium arboreum TaxID=29729 RepID=A0ABR0MF70_GOSAR|nr:hypothetical protein PVK06_047173 [Gossypium arboreum]